MISKIVKNFMILLVILIIATFFCLNITSLSEGPKKSSRGRNANAKMQL